MKIALWLIKLKILVKQNVWALSVLVLWFVMGTVAFYILHEHNIVQATACALYRGSPVEQSSFSNAYIMFGPVVLIPVALTILMNNMEKKYRPELGSRLLAKETQNHIVVVGYTHLGIRLIELFRSKGVPYVLVEENLDLVRDLVKTGEAVVVDDPRDLSTLEDAGVKKAKAVIVAMDDLRHIFLITKKVRDLNKKCFLIARCFEDELTEVLESLGANVVISSSKKALEDIINILRL